jgi:hypothetical protein
MNLTKAGSLFGFPGAFLDAMQNYIDRLVCVMFRPYTFFAANFNFEYISWTIQIKMIPYSISASYNFTLIPEFGPGGIPKAVSIPILVRKSFNSLSAANCLFSITTDSGLGFSDGLAL